MIGRTTLLTGAAELLGPEHAAALLACGAKVVLTDTSEAAHQSSATVVARAFDPAPIFTKVMVFTEASRIGEIASRDSESTLRCNLSTKSFYLTKKGFISTRVQQPKDLGQPLRATQSAPHSVSVALRCIDSNDGGVHLKVLNTCLSVCRVILEFFGDYPYLVQSRDFRLARALTFVEEIGSVNQEIRRSMRKCVDANVPSRQLCDLAIQFLDKGGSGFRCRA